MNSHSGPRTFAPLTIRALLACAFTLLAVLLVAVGACGAFGISSTNEALESASEYVPALRAVDQQQKLIARARLKLERIASTIRLNASSRDMKSADTTLADSDKAWVAYLTFPADEDEKRIAKRVADAREDLKKNGLEPLLTALESNNLLTAQTLMSVSIPGKYEVLNDATERLSLYQTERSARLYAEGKSRERTTLMLTVVATLVGFACALGAWRIVTRAISRPLAVATRHLEAMERGDLTTRIVAERDDELGALLDSLGKMQSGLRQTISTIRNGIELVASAAGEIAIGNSDLSRRTEQQAASLEETAASMEQLSATVKHNAANTLQASTLATAVSDTAGRGATAVERALGTMNSLKQGAGKITEITTIIESIAFQTNILALNAAVEAARAGEQGRGFAVVATEVRSLAQRSGSAAKEIKELIDASVSSVLEGATQAAEAGDRMDETLEALRHVTTLIDEITSASQEQARGIEQVTTAVSHMDEATQQNAALVEEAAAASNSMEEQASRMREVVASFETGGAAH